MTTTTKLSPKDKPTEEQLKRIEEAATLPVIPDEDSPVYTTEQPVYLYVESKRMNIKKTIGIRLSQKTIEQYKAMGKSYTRIMAAIMCAKHAALMHTNQ
jgi:uncharacterized protein (DUF4415 family)